MSQLIQSKIDLVRRKHAMVRAGFGVGMIGIVMVSVIAGTMLLDWWFELPYLMRCGMLALHIAAILFVVGRFVVWPLIKGPDDETVALWIESFYEDAASRLISAVQFSRPALALEGTSKQMVGAAIREAEEYIHPRDTGEVVAVDAMMKRIGIAALMVVVFGGCFFYGKQTTRDLFLRAMAVPGVGVPRKTQVELLTPVKRIVARGDAIRIEVKAHGVIPDEGTIRVKYGSGATAEFYLKKDRDEPEKFAIDIENIQDSFSYRAYLNDGRSVEATIDAHARPDVTDIHIMQHLPAYTKKPPVSRNKSDLQLLAGSRLQLRVEANKPVRDSVAPSGARNRVKFEGTHVEYYLKRDPNDPKILVTSESGSASVALPKNTTGMSIHLVDELGLESKDPAIYRIEVVPDTPPVVNLTFPLQREELVTERAKTTVGFEINDDIAVAGARIRWMPVGHAGDLQGDGLKGTYFNTVEPEGEAVFERIDGKIDYNFRDQSPDPRIPVNNFSIRWVGKILPLQTGTHVFQFSSDDGVRMWVGETQILDKWGPLSQVVESTKIDLEAGKMIDVRIEYQELTADARCQMMWIGPDKRREVVPTRVLFSGDDAVRQARMRNVQSIDLDIRDQQRSVRGQYQWDLSTLKLKAGDSIEWWVEARDGNDQTGPGITESEHRSIKIGTDAQVREYLLGRLGNPLEAIEEIQEGQVDLTSTLGQIILQKPPSEANPQAPKP